MAQADDDKVLRMVPEPPEGSAEEPAVPWKHRDFVPTVESIRSLFIEKHGQNFLTTRDRSAFAWDSIGWQRDEHCHKLREALGLFCCRVSHDINKKNARKTLESGSIVSTLAARMLDRGTVSADDLDPASLINVRSGTLRSGSLTPHRREDLLTLRTNVEPRPGEIPVMNKFLDEVFDHDAELINYVWRMLGYCLSGETCEQAMFFLWGAGGNGKSLFVRIIGEIFGTYATSLGMDVLASTKQTMEVERLLAHLRGRHIVTSAETTGGRWNEGLIKTLTGGDRLRGRHMYAEAFEFEPRFKLLVFGNEKPGLEDVGHAIKRRMQLIPFIIKIENPDLSLIDKLRAEYPQILMRIIQGLSEWRQRGLDPPAVVASATQDMFSELDYLQQWIDLCCYVDNLQIRIASGHLYADYQKYILSIGERPMSHRKFSQGLKSRGFAFTRSNGSFFYGIEPRRMRPDPDNQPSTGDMLRDDERADTWR